MKKIVGFIKIKNKRFNIYNSDIFVVSYPRSGNTWLRYLITNIIHHNTKVDFDLVNRTVIDFYHDPNLLLEEKPKRFIKSHESYSKSYPKVIYIYRDGRDASGSYYKFYQNNLGYKKSFDIFLKEMLNGELAFGSWQNHIKSWLFRKHKIPFFPIKYEDCLVNTESIVKQLCKFIDMDINPDMLKQAIDKSSIRNQNILFAKFQNRQFKQFQEIVNQQFKWINYFNKELQDLFFDKAGEVMSKLEYKKYSF